MPQPVEVTSKQVFSELLEKSQNVPVLLYKHSISCPVSGQAWYEVQDCLEFGDDPPSCYRVTVQMQPELSRAVADHLEVAHHTPQVIVVRDGRASYVASHWKIRKQALQRALAHTIPSTQQVD